MSDIIPRPVDFGYPGMTSIEEDQWFLAFYCGRVLNACSIWGMRLKL